MGSEEDENVTPVAAEGNAADAAAAADNGGAAESVFWPSILLLVRERFDWSAGYSEHKVFIKRCPWFEMFEVHRLLADRALVAVR